MERYTLCFLLPFASSLIGSGDLCACAPCSENGVCNLAQEALRSRCSTYCPGSSSSVPSNAIWLILRFIKAKLPPDGRAQSLLCPAGSRERKRVRRKRVLISVAQEQGAHTHKLSLLSKEEAHLHAERQKKAKRVAFHPAQRARIITHTH